MTLRRRCRRNRARRQKHRTVCLLLLAPRFQQLPGQPVCLQHQATLDRGVYHRDHSHWRLPFAHTRGKTGAKTAKKLTDCFFGEAVSGEMLIVEGVEVESVETVETVERNRIEQGSHDPFCVMRPVSLLLRSPARLQHPVDEGCCRRQPRPFSLRLFGSEGIAFLRARRTSLRCTPGLRATARTVPTPDSSSRRVGS
jgi:hypothetical protein